MPASTPSLEGISSRAEVKLPGGKTACIRPVPLDPNVRDVQMLLDTRGKRAPAVELTMTGPGGYRATGRFAGYAPSDASLVIDAPQPGAAAGGRRAIVRARHRPPGHRSRRNGRARVRHAAGDLRWRQAPWRGRPGHHVPRRQAAIARAAGGHDLSTAPPCSPARIPGWLMWPLALLFVLGLPLGAAWALLLSARSG